MLPSINTEIRITHKTLEDKKKYEIKLDEALKMSGYANRTEFVREMIRRLIKEGV